MKLARRISALILTGALLGGSCFYAAESNNTTPTNGGTQAELQPGEVRAKKDLVRDASGNPVKNPDGSYTIQLDVQGKNTTRKIENADIIFIATHSKVNNTSITPSHNAFIKKILESGKGNKVGVVTNCTSCGSSAITDSYRELEKYMRDINGKWDAETYEHGLDKPLTKGIELLNQRQDKSRPVYVFITGIKPGLNDVKDPAHIQFLKMNRTHTILLGAEAATGADAFREYGEVECIPYGGDLNAKVAQVLDKWANEMFILPAKAGSQAVMTDTVNTEVFDYSVSDPKIQDNKNGVLKWNIGDIPETKQSVTFNVTPKKGKFGTVKTNNDVVLDYLDVLDKPAKKLKPEIGDPEITIPEYTVTYTDGVEKYEIFKDQVYNKLNEGDPTPKFEGMTTQKGYTFKGWSPEVVDTVTGNVTYTAQWEEPVEMSVTYTDGVNEEEIFKDVKFTSLREGDKTPLFITDEAKIAAINEKAKEDFKKPREHLTPGGQNSDDQKPGEESQNPKPDEQKPGDTTKPDEQKPNGEEGQKNPDEGVKAKIRRLLAKITGEEEQKNPGDTQNPKPDEQKPGDTTKPDDTQNPDEQKPGETTKPDTEVTKAEEPRRDGYVFKGWEPKVEETVKNTVTYTAQWEKIPTYTVTYTDGVDNETIFEDKVFEGLRKDEVTPEFDGEPSRKGFTFKGWSPEVAEKISGDATYVAQWEPIPTYTVTYTDGVDNETIFEDKVFSGLTAGMDTPKFEERPTRSGYEFRGWTPAVAEKVSGNATYTAVWVPLPMLPKTGVAVASVPVVGAIVSGIYLFRKRF